MLALRGWLRAHRQLVIVYDPWHVLPAFKGEYPPEPRRFGKVRIAISRDVQPFGAENHFEVVLWWWRSVWRFAVKYRERYDGFQDTGIRFSGGGWVSRFNTLPKAGA